MDGNKPVKRGYSNLGESGSRLSVLVNAVQDEEQKQRLLSPID
jgi:hypothetical protein